MTIDARNITIFLFILITATINKNISYTHLMVPHSKWRRSMADEIICPNQCVTGKCFRINQSGAGASCPIELSTIARHDRYIQLKTNHSSTKVHCTQQFWVIRWRWLLNAFVQQQATRAVSRRYAPTTAQWLSIVCKQMDNTPSQSYMRMFNQTRLWCNNVIGYLNGTTHSMPLPIAVTTPNMNTVVRIVGWSRAHMYGWIRICTRYTTTGTADAARRKTTNEIASVKQCCSCRTNTKPMVPHHKEKYSLNDESFKVTTATAAAAATARNNNN